MQGRQIANFSLLMAAERALIGYEIEEKEIDPEKNDEKESDEEKVERNKSDGNRNKGVAHHVGRR